MEFTFQVATVRLMGEAFLAEIESNRRYTVLTVLGMLVASAVAVFIGFIGFGLWMTNLMTFAGALNTQDGVRPELFVFLFLSAGPFAAGAGLILGWLMFLFGNPKGGIKWALLIPILWGLAVLAFLGIVMSPLCDGHFTCGLTG